MRAWLGKWGYRRDLFSCRTRGYVLSVHCEVENMALGVERVENRELDRNAWLMESQCFGKLAAQQALSSVEIYELADKGVHTYAARNITSAPLQVTMDCSRSEGLLFSTGTSQVTKTVLPGSWETLLAYVRDSTAPNPHLSKVFH
jgi:hypothetical protein